MIGDLAREFRPVLDEITEISALAAGLGDLCEVSRQFPFFDNYEQIVMNAMLMEVKPTHRLSYKTGLGVKEDGTPITWIVGWIEENEHPYFFVLNMETKDKSINLEDARMTVLRNILTQLNFFKGQR